MIKRMLIDDTNPEETRVVVVNGNKLEDVECETAYRRQIKGNIYLAKVMRVEPSLQAAFVDYGGNKHGFLAFGEIHPDYYNVSEEELAEIDAEVDEIIEAKKQAIKEREQERERIRIEKMLARQEAERLKAEQAALAAQQEECEPVSEEESAEQKSVTNEPALEETSVQNETSLENAENEEVKSESLSDEGESVSSDQEASSENSEIESEEEKLDETSEESDPSSETQNEEPVKKVRKYYRKRPRKAKRSAKKESLKVLAEDTGTETETVKENVAPNKDADVDDEDDYDLRTSGEALDEEDDDDQEYDFDLQRKLIKARKLYHRHSIQEVIKEGQILLVQIVKEERGNKGAALTTYLSLAGRYCVLMPNRIKSGGVSRKITNAADRKRLKSIVKELPLTSDMSIIVRTAGEEKTKADIVRDYNYLIRSWNQIRIASLINKAPIMIHEEGNLIKRALRDIYTKDISEILVAGDNAFKMAKDFFRILSPHNVKKIKHYRSNDIPLFQRFQVETQLDKLHDTNAQLESGGYLVINPTEALVSIDVNSGRATKEKDLEETALKTNLEACDEIARQLRMRNLAGLVVVDFIDMDEPANNHAVERRMKEALKKDRSRVQVGKMSCFGLLELSRQRMHSSFFESNYTVCPYCGGKGLVRTIESGAVLVLRGIEEEGIRNRSAQINVFVPTEIAVYLLNHKRAKLMELEKKYGMSVIISADGEIKNVSDYRIERMKQAKNDTDEKRPVLSEIEDIQKEDEVYSENVSDDLNDGDDAIVDKDNSASDRRRDRNKRSNRKDRRDRNRGRDNRRGNKDFKRGDSSENGGKEKQEAVILYNSHGNAAVKEEVETVAEEPVKEKTTWWKKLIKG